MRKPIIVGNWKMHKTIAETSAFIKEVEPFVNDKADYGIATSFLSLACAKKEAKKLLIAAQNCHYEDEGAFTGEVSIPMLQELGLTYCIIGHSERRQYFGDTNETVNKKAKALLAKGLIPILCVGETEQEFDSGLTKEVLRKELIESLSGLKGLDLAKVILAYEPIWAIGTGKSANKEIAQNCCHYIREVIAEMAGKEVSEKIRIQYGGSVKPTNLAEYMQQEDIDGALVGGAALKSESFIAMMKVMEEK